MNSDDIYDIQEFGLDLDNREIWLTPDPSLNVGAGEESTEVGVEWIMAAKFLKNLRILQNSTNHDEPILIHMKTNGGIHEEGMAIFDAISACPCPVTILSYTHARSMSSIILQAADKRVLMPNSCFMFHEGENMVSGTDKQVRTWVKWGEFGTKKMLDLYVHVMTREGCWEDARLARQWLIDEMNDKEDVYLTAKEAIKNGFADEIFNGDWDGLTEYPDHISSRWSK